MVNKNTVIYELTGKIYEIIEEEMQEEYNNEVARAADCFEIGETYSSQIDTYIKSHIRSWIRDMIENDYKSLIERMPENVILSYEEEQVKELLKVLFFLRKESSVFFYREKKAKTKNNNVTATKSINANLTKGSLSYAYEEYGDLIIKIYNQRYSKEIRGFLEEQKIEEEYLSALKEVESYINKTWGLESKFREYYWAVITLLELIYNTILNEANDEKKNLSVYLTYMDLILGVVRVILTHIKSNNFYSFRRIKDAIEERYIALVKKNLDIGIKNDSPKYMLVQNYNLYMQILSMRKEREVWIQIYDFLLNEDELPMLEADIKIPDEKLKACNKVKEWYINQRKVMKEGDEKHQKLLMRAIYSEAYIYTVVPEFVANRKWRSFLTYIQTDEAKNMDNMNLRELFYFEKIRRGLYREYGCLDEYRRETNIKKKLYELEILMFSEEYMKNGYLGIWVKAIKDSLEELLNM